MPRRSRTIGGSSRDRRRTRRAAERRQTGRLRPVEVAEIEALVAAASGSTSLPLSDQDVTWDADAAEGRVRKWADAADGPNAKYASAFLVKQGDGSNFGDYKLPFADVIDDKLTAVWKGITAVAGVLQGARGGANITDAEESAAKTKVEGYYAKAAKQYDDDGIKVPWAADESAGESAAFLLAYAEVGCVDLDAVRTDEGGMAYGLGRSEGCPAVFAADAAEIEEFRAALDRWTADLDLPKSVSLEAEIEEIAASVVEAGGKPSKGTAKDKRLRDNKPGTATPPEEATLDALDAYQASVACSCGHPYSEHSGAGGTCQHADGRGGCRCGEFSYPESPDAGAIATAYVKIRPDLEGFEAEVERVVQRAIRNALAAAAGDVAWGPEEGFVDLLCDVNEQLAANYGGGGYYYYDEAEGYWGPGPRAVDASVNLDKVLICDQGCYYVAPIEVDAAGEPVLADKGDWVTVENGWIETEGAMATLLRNALRDADFKLTAAGATAPPIPAEHEPSEVLPAPSGEPTPPPDGQARSSGPSAWNATFVPEGILTEDGRAFAPNGLILPPEEGSRELPLTLMAMIETSAEGGHDGAKVAGRIDQLWREQGEPDPLQLVKSAGVFSDEEFGQMIARMVGSKELTGLSVDIAPLEWERGPRSDWFGEDGQWIATMGDDGEWQPAGEPPTLEDAVDRLFGGGEDQILVITKGVIGMATVCPFPAFGKASISLVASADGGMPIYRLTIPLSDFTVETPEALLASFAGCDCEETEVDLVGADVDDDAFAGETITAAAAGLAPADPPAEWFEDPELEELTPLTITDDGRIYGHAWEWDTCHLSFEECVVAPHSETNYAYFMLGEVKCSDDESRRLSVGKITLDTSHAGQRLSRQEATRHYDHTGTVAAHVAFGEDEHGGWFAGAINPELSEEKLRILRGSTVSGDWRGVDGNLELIALLAVNVPGFPVPRKRASASMTASGTPEILSLTAAGIVTEERLSAAQHDEIAQLAAEAEE